MQLGVQDKREAAPPKTLREKTLGCAPVDSLPLIHLSCADHYLAWLCGKKLLLTLENLSGGCKSFLPFCGKQPWSPVEDKSHCDNAEPGEKDCSVMGEGQ